MKWKSGAPTASGAFSLTALIAEGDAILSRALREVLEPTVTVVGEAKSSDEVVGLARSLQPHIVIVGFHLPPSGGLQAIREIKAEGSDARVVLLTLHEEAYLEATGHTGADALLPARDVRAALIPTLRTLTRGHVPAWEGTERRERWPPTRGRAWDGRERRRGVSG